MVPLILFNVIIFNIFKLVELGYTISSLDLDFDNINPYASSIKNIANYVSGSTPFESLLRGNLSFGACLEAEG